MEVIQGFRLSPQQRRVWLLQRDSRAFRSQCAIAIDGPLDIHVLKETVHRLIERHEILRTTFECLPGMKIPVQVTGDDIAHSLCEVDFSDQPAAERSGLVDQLFDEMHREGFDTQLGVADRYTLVRLSPVEHVLLISLPALCADKQTLNNLLAEVTCLYQESEDLEETVQYAQFSAWQHELLEENDGEAGHEFWRKQSSFTAPSLKLPLESSPTEISTFAPRTHTFILDNDVPNGAFLFACWQSLLRRLTKQEDIAVRYLCNGRAYEEMSDAFGLYDRWPLLHSQFEEDEPFAKVLEQIESTVTDACEWQEYYPGGDEVDESIGFDFTEQPAARLIGDLKFSITRQYSCTERMKLRLSCTRTEHALIAEFHYDPSFYNDSAIDNLAGQFAAVVRSVTNCPDSTISELEIVGERERQKLLVEWNATQAEFEHDATIQQLFETQAAMTPDALAVLCDDQKLTFDELNCRANQLARHLQSFGVGAETRVALCVERSLEMIVGLLGILKAGGAYVPLDVAQPSSRLSFMLEDAQVGVLLTQESLTSVLPAHNARVVCLDTDSQFIAQHDSSNLTSQATAQNLAYMIYTSGSTGRPKGTMIEHRSVINLLGALNRTVYANVDHALRVSVNAPLAFDSSVKQVIQLLNGHALFVIPEETRRDGERMLRYLAEHEVDVLDCTPSQLRLLLSSGLGTYDQLRVQRVLVGGEAIDAALWQQLATQDSIGYFNVYGPTECTVDTTVRHITKEQSEPTLGRAISNVQVYILDERQQLMPLGMTGELCIGGEGVGRGYHNTAALTAEKFIPDPFSAKAGGRLYRTGDAARFTQTGELEFSGRLDGQVKIRGSRIELGEVEVALSAHPSVQQCVVVARDDAQGGARLVAYVVLHESESTSVRELRVFLSENLPDYMIPSVVMFLDEMPLTPNGKINRQALPAPGQMRPDLDEAFAAPRTPGEGILAGMWEHLLSVERVGINDDFFELGGHSLLAMQLISRVREAFQIEIPLPALFESPTIATLAVRIEEIVKAGDGLLAPPIRPVPRSGNMPLSFAQTRLWFLNQLDPDSVIYNIPLAIRLRGGINIAAMQQALTEIVRRHEVLRTTFATVAGQPIQIISPPQPFSLPVVDLSNFLPGLREAEAARLQTAEATRPFNLSEGPLMRATLLVLEEDEYLAMFTMHHITSDGWSMALLTREVSVLYEAFSAGVASPLPDLTVQYADFAQWQRNWLQGEVLEAHLDFWKQQMDGAPLVHQLPTDRPRPAVPTYRGANLPSLALPVDVSAKLKALSREEGVTLFMTMIAAFQTLLYRYSGQPDIVVGTGIAGRNRAEIEGLIGFFVNSLVLRTDLSGNPTFRELLARVREITLGAYAHQDLPFDVLVEALQPERNLNYNPLFQVMLVLQNTPLKRAGVSGLGMSSREVDAGTSKFDLYLVVNEGPENLSLGLEYSTDLFDETTMTRLARHFETLLESIVSDPGQRVSELQMLSEEERQRTLSEWSEASDEATSNVSGCVQQMFSRMAARYPDNAAIVYQDKQYSYAELEERANTIANYLISKGTQKGSLVGILAKDSFHVISSILGILKAGCVFVPFDRQLPQQRLAKMVSLVAPEWFIIEARFWDILSGVTVNEATVICVDGDAVSNNEQHLVQAVDFKDYFNPAKPFVESEPDDMAYIYFTSGSTGQPKAIAGRLQGIDHFIRWQQEALGAGEGVRVSRLLPVSFDGSLRDIFLPLCSGGIAIGPPPRDTMLQASKLVEWLEEHEINVIHCVPSLFRSLGNEMLTSERLPALKYILMAGEPLLPSDVGRWMDVFGERVQLVNLYGTSETTMAKFIYFVQAADRERRAIPIGKPMAGARAMLVNGKGDLSEPGTIGEIYIRTPYRSLGYYNQPELTRDAFIPDPFGDGEIVYKTGDLGRVLEDGNYEYLGRKDQQVKIRGIRVELSEVESLLRGHDGVRDVAVIDRDDANGFKYLCAYVVFEEEAATNAAELRDYLATYLPEYMIPSSFVPMQELPRTISGKLDRRALPAPGQSRAGLETYVAPRTPVEEVLAGIWSDVLRATRVGVNDNFFELSGHSLLAMQVISRIREAFGVEIFVRAIFEKQTLAKLAAEVEQLMNQGGSMQAGPLVRTSRDVELPLSFAQQRLWFIDRFEPGSPVYNMPMAVRLNGALNLGALERTLREIIRRHESLRTSFVTVDGKPVQVIRPEAHAGELYLPLVDLSSLSEAAREQEAKRVSRVESRRPFDLETDALMRATVLRLAEQQHIALLTFHHIIFDGWSMGVFVKEVVALYTAFSQGLESPLAELPVQYADYAVWQQEWLQGEVLDQQIGYWKQQLEGAPELLELPTDHPRPVVQTHRGARVGIALSKELTAKLRELSRAEGSTLFMLLLAVFKVLLARYSGQEDISVGTPIAGRNRVETESLIGFFVNTLVLRTDLSGNPTVRELIRRVREIALGAYAHQELPFERLVDELQVERSLSHTPLFQVLFVLQNTSDEVLELPGLSLTAAGAASDVVKYDLMLNLSETSETIYGALEYNTDLFDETTIKRMLSHFYNLFETICADPNTRLQDLSLLSEEESRHLLLDFNPPAPALPPAVCIHQLFESQAARRPDAVAVTCNGVHLTYEEINARANQLAHHLRSLGVRPEQRVAMLLDRTQDLVIAILGILKAGAAYLPLDPSYPQERLSFMLEDAGAQVIVTEPALAELQQTGLTVVRLNDPAVVTAPTSNVTEVGVTPENAAYVIYTSGSTGQPKGVVVTHENVWRLLEVTRADFAFDEHDIWTLFHSVCFDFSVWELWGPLTHGGRLVVVPYWVSREPESFYELLREEGVTILNQTPSAFRQLMKVDEAAGGELPLRVVIFGGEALEMSTLRGWFERHGEERPRLVNMYGITETTVHVTYRELKASDVEGGSVIGGALGDLELYVLDQQLRAVPEGVSGELYVGGAGVARGYLGRAELTAQRFVPHPYSERAGARLYRTGDLARRRTDGELEYLGRIDEQVKIRGFRIELGEIANALREQAGVRECVVLALGENGQEKRLVAYVVAEEEGVNAGELREELKQGLPEYMIPSAIVLLEEMPLTRNGKVDRRALPAPEEVSSEAETFVAPRTPVEEVLAGIWCDVLRATRVGVNDNFFELGGHSLLAMQVVSRIREAFSIEIPVRAIFEKQTVALLATEVEQLMNQGGSLYAPPIERRSRDIELPLSFAQQRLWFIDRLTPGSPLYNMPMAVRLDGALNLDALVRTLREIVRRHEVLRTNIVTVDGKPVQVIRPEAYVDEIYLPLVDLSSLPEDLREAEVRRLAHVEAVRPFDLETDALMRTTVLRQHALQHIALLTFHHIVSDGWSMGVFVREVAALYNAFSQGLPSPLTELPVQYADYAMWQREWLQGEVLEQHIGYWKQQLEGVPELLELPTDRPRPAVQTHRGANVGMNLSKELTAKLREVCRAEGVTLFMLLAATLKVLLARYTGQDDISMGTPIAGRNRVETEGLIGFFVNTLVMRTDLSGNPSARELLRRVREVALGAYAHQELPFEKLVDELHLERSLSHTPLFQIVFALQNNTQEVLELPGLSLSAAGASSGVAKYDLTLNMSESGEVIGGALEYNTDLFDETTIRRFVAHYKTLLESLVSDPAQRLSELQLLTDGERQRTLSEWSKAADATGAFEATECLQDSFEAQVERAPEAIALVFGDQEISYRELNNRANQLAHYLHGVGVGEESLVGILVERSVEMLVGILGVLKAGGAYVPLDPSYPQDRLSFMVADAGVEVLLTQQHLTERLDSNSFATLCLDRDWSQIAEQSTDNPTRHSVATNAAYVIYTSGSTGRPKGVVVPHAGAINLADAQRRAFDVNFATRVLQFASLSFDASVSETFVTLLCGATLCLAKHEQMAGSALHKLLQQQAIEVVTLPPTVLATLETDDLPCLRTVVTAGEACTQELAARWSTNGRRFINAYGPTETTVCATMSDPLDGECQPPIGRPMTNMQAYVLDKYMQPVAIGVVGELYVGGAGVTRGYLHRPELTAEKFVPHPFSFHSGARLYRTGDYARYLDDGQLEYIGRIDEQVKVRGFRIELQEVEAVLLQHEQVQEAVVVARADESGERRLVAYLVTHDDTSTSQPTTSELRLHVKKYLPEYMVPSAFVLLESFPVTPAGKVDKKKLPALTTARPALASEFVKPQTELEKNIAAVWQELLQLSEIGTEDNFFDLGGNSLLLVQLHARLQKIFGEQLKMVDLFEHPTIGSLALILSREEPSAAQEEQQAARLDRRITGKQRQRQRLEQRKLVLTPRDK